MNPTKQAVETTRRINNENNGSAAWVSKSPSGMHTYLHVRGSVPSEIDALIRREGWLISARVSSHKDADLTLFK